MKKNTEISPKMIGFVGLSAPVVLLSVYAILDAFSLSEYRVGLGTVALILYATIFPRVFTFREKK